MSNFDTFRWQICFGLFLEGGAGGSCLAVERLIGEETSRFTTWLADVIFLLVANGFGKDDRKFYNYSDVHVRGDDV